MRNSPPSPGAIFQTAGMDENELRKNFADIEFFKKIVPVIASKGMLTIATFADEEEDALVSGLAMVRKYLDVALGDSSKYIPGEFNERQDNFFA